LIEAPHALFVLDRPGWNANDGRSLGDVFGDNSTRADGGTRADRQVLEYDGTGADEDALP
jgi:hypothetical protein